MPHYLEALAEYHQRAGRDFGAEIVKVCRGRSRRKSIEKDSGETTADIVLALAVYGFLCRSHSLSECKQVVAWIDGQIARINGLDPIAWDAATQKLPAVPAGISFIKDHDDWLLDLYEQYLQHQDRYRRKTRGVFYTPRPLANYAIRAVDACLKKSSTRPWGLASPLDDNVPPVQVLDPALGSGVFLTAACEQVHSIAAAHEKSPVGHVSQWLARQFRGIDISLASLLIAIMRVARLLERLGHDFCDGPQLQLAWGNPLVDLDIVHWARGANVVVGNPPYRSLSTNQSDWMSSLLRGRDEVRDNLANYYEVDQQPLGERKAWLHDDYVKFLRLAHYLLELSDEGVVALVTNHSFLTNPTFRGLRWQLLQTFSGVQVLDLHGNLKSASHSPAGERDENLFGVEAGIAFTLLAKNERSPDYHYQQLWGSRETKLNALLKTDTTPPPPLDEGVVPLHPQPPYFFLSPTAKTNDPIYEHAIPLPEAMPIFASAVVTARDRLVVGLEKDELEAKIESFLDPSISDQQCRENFFGPPRTTRYPRGDTRSWQLGEARTRLRSDAQWRNHLRTCMYRPFDRRWILWTEEMIDWPRKKVMNELLDKNNYALIARRQMLPSQPCNFFWVTDDVTIDGIIRSDNRGNEFLFPLYARAASRRCNFSDEFLQQIRRQTGVAESSEDLCRTLFGYIYALFQSPTFQTRFADSLRIEYPRIPIPVNSQLLRQLAEVGWRLIDLHCGKTTESLDDSSDTCESAPMTVQPRYPKYIDGRIWVNPEWSVAQVPEEVWQYQIGKHQVCDKWLRDRVNRELSTADLKRYRGILRAIANTLREVDQIDRILTAQSDWGASFIRSSTV